MNAPLPPHAHVFDQARQIRLGTPLRAKIASTEVLMAAIDWSQCPAVESVPGKVSGAWVFRGTRMPVATVFENLESGATIEDIIAWFGVTREQVTAVLDFAARSLEVPVRRWNEGVL